jgi:hypothetical protein
MRLSGFLSATVLAVCLNPTCSYAQSGEQRRSEEQPEPEPYHKHHDTRHGHDHSYPDRGAIVRDLPRGTIGVNYADVSYRYHDGIWLEPRGPAFIVVAPPIGIVVPTLPTFSTTLAQGGETYLYANDTYYRPRADLGGYEVVNEPAQGLPQNGPDAFVGGQLPGAAPAAPAIIATGGISTPAAQPVSGQAATVPTVTQAAAFRPSAPAATTTASITAAPVPVTLPTGPASVSPSSAPPKVTKVFLYPKNGQTSDQQARDRYECYRFAVAQSGFDPASSPGVASSAPSNEPQSDFERAQSACFDARGYVSR